MKSLCLGYLGVALIIFVTFPFASASAEQLGADSCALFSTHRGGSGFFEVDGLNMYYNFNVHDRNTQASEDRPVHLVIHGAGSNSYAYKPLTDKLDQDGHDTLTIDLPNHGHTLVKSGIVNVGFWDQGRYLVALLNHLNIKNAIIYGHSMGAAPALTSAIQFKRSGGHVAALFLDDPYVMPLEDYYAQNPDELLALKVSKGVTEFGKLQMLVAAVSLPFLGWTGLPQATLLVGAANAGLGKIGQALTRVLADATLPIAKYNSVGDRKKIGDSPALYQLEDGNLPGDAAYMARATLAAFDGVDMRTRASQLGDTPVVIILGKINNQVPRPLIAQFAQAFTNARIEDIGATLSSPVRAHLHPMDAPDAVASAMYSAMQGY